jgi:hypothetical protein
MNIEPIVMHIGLKPESPMWEQDFTITWVLSLLEDDDLAEIVGIRI